ncbi:phage tail assembly chaperone [Thauera propionica]|uniref:phage tail assembly chaperone n=1 Tax=Thauera propionica TaxID=2019431 RepID=UPI0023F0FB1D|nr:phage tail assembly chaperone [Thauera propionica]MDD3675885.1 phage tail assembly chaperone [Thauera propionica]
MFKLQPDATFTAVAQIPVAGQGTKPLTIEFKYHDRDALARFFDSLSGRKDEDILADIVIDWKDIDAAFDLGALGQLCKSYPGAAGAIVRKFLEEASGARAKN